MAAPVAPRRCGRAFTPWPISRPSQAAAPTWVFNPALYAIAAGTNYTNCFHDITTGNNIGNNTPGLFYATNGYDLATGLGTPNGTNLINALAPRPGFIKPPASQTATNGNTVVFSPVVGGQPPFGFRWLLNGTNLPAGGNSSGTTNNVLTLTAVTTNNSGNYQSGRDEQFWFGDE